MSSTSNTAIINDVFDSTPTAGRVSIRETVEYLDAQGLLGSQAVKVDPGEIKSGDWIAYFYDGSPSEFYLATHDGDDNLNYSGGGAEFFRVDRSVFGKAKPVIKVEDLEPGTRFKANLLTKSTAEYVRLKGLGVLQVSVNPGVRWSAINRDFTNIEIID